MSTTTGEAGAKPRVLVVDDDKAVRESLRRSLEFNGYEVALANDGAEALAGIGSSDPDVVIMDVMMPRLDGIEATRALRSARNDVPILVLTARDAVGDRVEGLDAGADDYLGKPFELDELLARVRALLRRGPELRPAVVTVGDLEIDTRAQGVTRGGRRVELTAKEFALLEFLARRAGHVVGRAEIAEHVWDASFDAFSNRIEVYIQRLRRKLDDGPGPRLIHTRRGAGYSLGTGDDV
jgi:two-component system, OmpR family, response regulator MprA